MQRLLALDFDARELCFVLATAVGERITLEAAHVIPLAKRNDSPPSDVDAGKLLQTALANYKRTGVKVLASVDRNAMELFEFTLPPASDVELPGLVMNQATMESPVLAVESIIDFAPRLGAATESRHVTAAALPKTELTRINSVCRSAGLVPDRMLVRYFETASLYLKRRTNLAKQEISLIVNVIDDEVDLIVVDQLQAVFFRTVRLPGQLGEEAADQRLLHEIRRTLLIAPQNADAGQSIASVCLFDIGDAHRRMVKQLTQECSIPVEILDPLDGFLVGDQWVPPTSGRVIPLLGMLAEEAGSGRHAIDFLHPRRAPSPPNRKRQVLVTALVTAIIGALGGYYYYEALGVANAENQQLVEELKDIEGLIKKTAEKKKVTAAINDWNANTVIWLDELCDLSTKFPSGQDLVIQRLSMTPARGGKANISFQGLAREPMVVTRMEATLRDDRHEVQTPRVEERVQDKVYTWNFETAISVVPKKVEAPELIEDERAGENTKIGKKRISAGPDQPSGTVNLNSGKSGSNKRAAADDTTKKPSS